MGNLVRTQTIAEPLANNVRSISIWKEFLGTTLHATIQTQSNQQAFKLIKRITLMDSLVITNTSPNPSLLSSLDLF